MPAKLLEARVRQQPGAGSDRLARRRSTRPPRRRSTRLWPMPSRATPRSYCSTSADVDYINSTGIALIVGLLAKARAVHRRSDRLRAE